MGTQVPARERNPHARHLPPRAASGHLGRRNRHPATAQEPEYQDLGDIVLSALRTASERLRTGVSVSVIGTEELAAARDTSLADTLARLPGVSITQSGPFGSTASLRIRGADGRYLAVIVDGIKVSDPSGTNVSFDWGNLMAADIARVEVLRGSQSALWGGSAVGGVVSITTRAATEDGLHQTVAVEGGSFSSGKLSYGATYKDDRAELSVNATHFRTDGFSAAAAGTEADGAESTRLSFTARYQLSDTLAVGGSAFWQNTTQAYDGYVGSALTDRDNTQDRTETGARLFAELEAGQTTHLFDLSVFDIRRVLDQSGSGSRFDGKRTSAGWQATTEASEALTVVYGLDWTKEEASYSNLPAAFRIPKRLAPSPRPSGRRPRRLTFPSPCGRTITRPSGPSPPGAWRLPSAQPRQRRCARPSPAASAPRRLTNFTASTPIRIIRSRAIPPDPEESLSYELGVEHAFASGATVAVTAFRLEIDNLVNYAACPLGPTFTCAPGTFSTLENLAGVSTRQGIELAANVPLSDRVGLGLAYTYTDSRNPSGDQLIRVPLHQLSLSLDADLSDRLSAGLSLTHLAGRVDNAADFSGEKTMPDYTVLDAVVSYDLTDTTEAYLRIENLTDESYQEVDGYATAGRSVYLGLQAKF